METLSAIPIRKPWIDMILEGSKTWEIRSKFTKKIGKVALIRSGSETVVAIVKLKPALAFGNFNVLDASGAVTWATLVKENNGKHVG